MRFPLALRFSVLLLLNSVALFSALRASESAPVAGATGEIQPPVVKKKVPPYYPAKLRKDGIEGAALIEFTVTETGDVMHAKVVRATERELGQAAMWAVEQWKFEPARLNGKPVSSRQQQPISFSLQDDDVPTTTPLLLDRPRFTASLPPKLHVSTQLASTSKEAFEALKKSLEMLGKTQTAFLKLPPSAKAPRVVHKVSPSYPAVLRDKGVSGGASYLMLIDDKGDVQAICCTMTTATEFVGAGAVALAQSKYTPAEIGEKPVPVLMAQTVLFETH